MAGTLFLVFHLGADRYVIAASEVVQILPLVNLKAIPHAPAGVRGAFNYQGEPVPVVDVSELTLGRPAPLHLSTRVVLVAYPDGENNRRLLGLVLERATGMMRRSASDFRDVAAPKPAPYLGPMVTDEAGLVQWIRPSRLLPPEVRDLLFRETVEVD